ncbi:hypothetical protein X777_01701, partial [Ooceraea biroi]
YGISDTMLSTLVYLHTGHASSFAKTANGLPGAKEQDRFIVAVHPGQERSLLVINSFVVFASVDRPCSKRGTNPVFVTARHEAAPRFYNRKRDGLEIVIRFLPGQFPPGPFSFADGVEISGL